MSDFDADATTLMVAGSVEAFMVGDVERSSSLLADAVPTEQAAFAVASGLCAILRQAGDALLPGGGGFRVEIDAMPGTSPTAEETERAHTAAAMVAALMNDDHPGALAMWRRLGTPEAKLEVLTSLVPAAARAVISMQAGGGP